MSFSSRDSGFVKAARVRSKLFASRQRELELGANNLTKIAKPKLFAEVVNAFLLERQAHWTAETRVMHATLCALLGWMSPKMIERFSHVRASAKRKAVSVFHVDASQSHSPPHTGRQVTM